MTRQRTPSQLLYWLWHHARRFRLQMLLNIFIGLLTVAIALGFVAITKQTIDAATHKETSITLSQGLAVMVGLLILQILIRLAERWVKALLGVQTQNEMQRIMFARLLGSEWASVRRYHSGDVLNRLLKDVDTITGLLTTDIPDFITTIFRFVGAFIFLCIMDARLAGIIIVVAPLFLLISKLYVKRLRAISHQVRAYESRAQSLIQESIQHILVIKTIGHFSSVLHLLTDTQQRMQKKIVEKTSYASFSSTLLQLGFAIGYMISFGWGVFRLQADEITYGMLLAFIQLVGQIQTPLNALSSYVPTFIKAATACERLIELEHLPKDHVSDVELHTPPPRRTGNTRQSMLPDPPSQNSPLSLSLHFAGVFYRYAPNARYILRNFTYTFPAGSVTAILGETGVGKTTLVRLMLSLIRPVAGKIHWTTSDGTCLPFLPENRRLFAYVPQGNSLLSGTIRENLLMAAPQADETQMRHALTAAVAHFVFELPDGLDTLCTEQGGGLSEGQAQRICIARALLRPCPYMLFDESTSALDENTEEILVRNLVEFCHNRTLIFVTHRPTVLQHCTQQLHLIRPKNI